METQQIPCPFCGTKQDFTFHPEVNVSAEPALKAPVLDGSIFEMTCVHCGRTARIGYPIRYTDPDAGVVLYLCGPEDDGQDVPIPAGSRLVRIVRAPWELAEKIITADSGLDDRTL